MKLVNPSLTIPAKIHYALLALLELASHFETATPLRINEIATRQPIPERYLEQIFNVLRRGGFVQSQRGAKGGYRLTREPHKITIAEVVKLIKGDCKESRATLNLERELVLEVWQQAQSASQAALQQYTLQDLLQRCLSRKQTEPMFYI